MSTKENTPLTPAATHTPGLDPKEVKSKVLCLVGYVEYLMGQSQRIDHQEIPAVCKEATEWANSLTEQ